MNTRAPGLIPFFAASIVHHLPAPTHRPTPGTRSLFTRTLRAQPLPGRATLARMCAAAPSSRGVAIFDATDTLMEVAEPVGRTYARFAARYAVPCEVGEDGLMARFKEEFRRMPPIDYGSLERGAVQQAEVAWWRVLVRNVLQCEDTPEFEACFTDCFGHYGQGEAWRLFPEALHTLAALREQGWGVGILSNFDTRLGSVLEQLGVMAHAQFLVLPADAGCAKPDPRIFKLALEKASSGGGGRGVCLYVGDSVPLDVRGALDAGLRPVLVDRRGKWRRGEGLPEEGCAVVDDLSGVVELARGIAPP